MYGDGDPSSAHSGGAGCVVGGAEEVEEVDVALGVVGLEGIVEIFYGDGVVEVLELVGDGEGVLEGFLGCGGEEAREG